MYHYGALNQVKKFVKVESSGKVTTYAYDDLGRITSESSKPSSTSAAIQSYAYTYDDYGNRSTLTATGTTAYI